MLRKIFTTLLIVISLSSCSTFSIREYNDFFATFAQKGGASDNNFSQGLSGSYSMTREKAPDLLIKAIQHLPSFKKLDDNFSEPTDVGVEMGQQIYTPSDLKLSTPITTENPYAGYLYGSVSRMDVGSDFRLKTTFETGMIGKYSYGREVQTWFHELCGCDIPQGWERVIL